MKKQKLIRIHIDSRMELLPLATKAIQGVCSCLSVNEELTYQVEVSAVEALSNVIQHAYLNKPGNPIEIVVTLEQDAVEIKIIDSGKKWPINIAKKVKLKIDFDRIENLPDSGFGIFIMQHFMDTIKLSHIKGQNHLVMRKKLKITKSKKK